MRISRDQMYIEIAQVVAKRSTCYRGNVGAIIVRDRRIIAEGYNGPPSGESHCQGNGCPRSSDQGCGSAIHAEVNAFNKLSPAEAAQPGLTLYCTHSPCRQCSNVIAYSGITRLVYLFKYRNTEGMDFLASRGVEIHQITPSGFLLNSQGDILNA